MLSRLCARIAARRKDDSGVTLPELSVTILVLTVLMGSLVAMVTAGVRVSTGVKERLDQSNTATTVGGTLFDTGDKTRSGWTVGAGYEYAFAPNWSAKIEYNYMDFGNKTPTLCSAAGACGTFNIDQTAQMALFGVNYRFGGGMMR